MFKHSRSKRSFALITLVLILINVFPSVSFANSVYFTNSSDNDTVDIYIRIFAPTSASPSNSVGHYDLMIGGALYVNGATFINPVFSYRIDGTLDIFSNKDTGSIYSHKKGDYFYGCHVYYYNFRVKGTDRVYAFLSSLSPYIRSVRKHPKCSRAVKCSLSGTLSNYNVKTINCYYAISTWAQIFGNNAFLAYYNNYYNGNHASYLPADFVSYFRSKLTMVM